MVVAAGAADGYAHDRRTQHLYGIGHHVELLLKRGVGGGVSTVGSQAQEACGCQSVDDFLSDSIYVFVIDQFVPGQLLHQESVVRSVRIEGADDVIPVAPGMQALAVLIDHAFGIGVSRYIQPDLGPPFSVVFRVKQTVHETFICSGRGIRTVLIDFFGLRRHAHQVQVGPAHESQPVCGGREREAFGFQFA